MTKDRLDLTRPQILAFRRHVGALDERLPRGRRSLRRAAWAGLQDSMPRAALLSIHARVEGTEPSTWEDPSLVQLWGPRYHAYVVAARDLAVFSLGRLPDDAAGRRGRGGPGRSAPRAPRRPRMTYGEAGDALGVHPNALRYAAPTGTVADPVGRRAAADRSGPCRHPRSTLARPASSSPAGTCTSSARPRPRRSPSGRGSAARGPRGVRRARQVADPGADADRRRVDPRPRRAGVPRRAGPAAPARLLPSGDAYFLLQGADRELLVPDAESSRRALDPARLAGRPPRRGRGRRDVAARAGRR